MSAIAKKKRHEEEAEESDPTITATADLPRFLKKTFELVSSPQVTCIEWAPDGRSLIVADPVQLAADVLPKHFKHNKFSSFVRQLNTYGFRKIDTDAWQFANANFIKGKPDLLSKIQRHKPESQAQGRERKMQPLQPTPSMELVKLESENGALKREMVQQRQQMAVMADNLAYLQKRQERTEEHQKQLMKFIATAMGVMGAQEHGSPALNMTALNTLQSAYAAGRPAKRQRFLEGAADSLSVENNPVESALPEVLEVQSPLASADSLGVDIPPELTDLLVAPEAPPAGPAPMASPSCSVGVPQPMQPLQTAGSIQPSFSITESMLEHFLPYENRPEDSREPFPSLSADLSVDQN